MLVLEELKEINEVIIKLAEFIQNDSEIKSDFSEYLKTLGIPYQPSNQFQSACFNYIFERNLTEELKSIPQIYLERNTDLPAEHKNIVEALTNAFSSIFEIKKMLKNTIEMYNIINEKTYDAAPLVKMTNLRGIGSGQFMAARLFKYNNVYYLIEITAILSSAKKDEACRYAVAKIIQNPEIVYLDNPEKQTEIENDIKKLYKSFTEYFENDEIITTNKYADELIGLFNDYAETGVKNDFSDRIHEPEKYQFFNVSEFNNSYDNFLENSLGGFSSHKEIYDVGIIYDKELGLYAVPFYETFNRIFTSQNPQDIPNYLECIHYFLQNDKYSANIIKRIAEKHDNFMEVINKALNTSITFDELIKNYKSRYLENKIYSPTTVLYKSKVFSSTLGLIEENIDKPQIQANNIGRNDPCPCGSGKKFKKCCGANL